MLTITIIVLVTLSYSFGVGSVLQGKYKPSIYSRFVWLLIGTNSLFSVFLLHNTTGAKGLAIVSALGCVLMLAAALKYSVRTFGATEFMCTILLGISGILWVFGHNPILNLALGLAAHFIGAVPSLQAVIKKPQSEYTLFWLFFATASILAFVQSNKTNVHYYLFPLYYAIFDSSMTLLAARQYLPKKTYPEVMKRM